MLALSMRQERRESLTQLDEETGLAMHKQNFSLKLQPGLDTSCAQDTISLLLSAATRHACLVVLLRWQQ